MIPILMLWAAEIDVVKCNWCVFGREEIEKQLIATANLSPKAMLKAVRSEGVCVKVMATGRKLSAARFAWGRIEKASFNSKEVSKIADLMGKSLCKDEHPIAKDCPTIVLADDAPKITLLHEYLHYRQARRDPNWCGISKHLWMRPATDQLWREVRDKEWDAHLILWHARAKLNLGVDDRIALANETISEAEQRKVYDGDGPLFLLREKPQEEIDKMRTKK